MPRDVRQRACSRCCVAVDAVAESPIRSTEIHDPRASPAGLRHAPRVVRPHRRPQAAGLAIDVICNGDSSTARPALRCSAPGPAAFLLVVHLPQRVRDAQSAPAMLPIRRYPLRRPIAVAGSLSTRSARAINASWCSSCSVKRTSCAKTGDDRRASGRNPLLRSRLVEHPERRRGAGRSIAIHELDFARRRLVGARSCRLPDNDRALPRCSPLPVNRSGRRTQSRDRSRPEGFTALALLRIEPPGSAARVPAARRRRDLPRSDRRDRRPPARAAEILA